MKNNLPRRLEALEAKGSVGESVCLDEAEFDHSKLDAMLEALATGADDLLERIQAVIDDVKARNAAARLS